MQLESIVRAHLSALTPFSENPEESAEAKVEAFTQTWREIGRALLAQQLQQQVEALESGYPGSRQKRTRRYQTGGCAKKPLLA
jgi:hypothetical protein